MMILMWIVSEKWIDLRYTYMYFENFAIVKHLREP